MVVYYKFAGVVADVALILNIVIDAGSPRPLPGDPYPSRHCRLVLSVGMAVDANILIHERIKEELRLGKTVRAAIDQGYHRAFSAIIDSNLTTLISGIILYQFGTGPVKGFAVTLCIGILANIFTAVYITRVDFRLSSLLGLGCKTLEYLTVEGRAVLWN